MDYFPFRLIAMKNITGFDSFEQNLKTDRKHQAKLDARFSYAVLGGLGLLIALGTHSLLSPKVTPIATSAPTVESTLPEKPPVEGAHWSKYEQSWMCPTGEFSYATMNYTSWANCTATDYPTEEEIAQGEAFEGCVGRANKEKDSAGEEWARAQCRENVEAF